MALDGKEAVQVILQSIQIGQEFNNLRRGTSKIYDKNDKHIVYIRGKSKIEIKTYDISDAFDLFKGKNCSSSDLRQWRPYIFDSKHNGHSCNCTFLFMLWRNANLIEGNIQGGGKSRNPFFVCLKCDSF
jgi:hypothetical protein